MRHITDRIHAHIERAFMVVPLKPNMLNVPEDFKASLGSDEYIPIDLNNIYDYKKERWFKVGVDITRKEAREHIIKLLKHNTYIHMYDEIDSNSCYLGILIKNEFKRYYIKDIKKALTLGKYKMYPHQPDKNSKYYDVSITEFNQELFNEIVVENYTNMKLEWSLIIKKFIDTMPDIETEQKLCKEQTLKNQTWGNLTQEIVSRTTEDLKKDCWI